MADCESCLHYRNPLVCAKCIKGSEFWRIEDDLWEVVMSGVSNELTKEVSIDYEAECERLMNKINILTEENLALTETVKGLSVALDMSKKLHG